MAVRTPLEPVTIGGIAFDARLTGNETYTADVPTYPVDSGYSVSDNAALGAMSLSMTLYLTATPVTWASNGTGEEHISSVKAKLIALYREREPVTVTTQQETYTSMVIKSVSFKSDPAYGVAMEIPIELVQVDITTSETVDIPSTLEHSGTTEADSGAADTSTVTADVSTTTSSSSSSSSSSDSSSSSSSNSTILKSVANSVTNFFYGS